MFGGHFNQLSLSQVWDIGAIPFSAVLRNGTMPQSYLGELITWYHFGRSLGGIIELNPQYTPPN